MSRESEFRKKLNNDEDATKEEIWSALENEIRPETNIQKTNDETVAVAKVFPKKNMIALIIGILLFVVIITFASYFIWAHFSAQQWRYCTTSDYKVEGADRTLKDYASENDKTICYIDWYDNSIYVETQYFILNNTEDIICIYEQAVLEDEKFVHLYVTDNRTEIDILEVRKESCSQTETIDGVPVQWSAEVDVSIATFEFNQHRYYLMVDENSNREYLFSLVKSLIKDK